MLHLTLAGLSEDNDRLLLVSDSGEEFTLTIDAKLRAALRGDKARSGQLETQMESTLRPRDIQARIRAGESPEAVAEAAHTTVEKILPFAGPVLAERAHVADRAQRSSVRRKSGDTGARTLGDALIAQLRPHNVSSETVEWDAWRREDGRWTLCAVYTAGSTSGTGHFTLDLPGNYVVADDDDARWLVGEPLQRPPAPPARDDLAQARRARQLHPDDDQLPLGDDALALVTPESEPAAVEDEPTVDLSETARAAREAGASSTLEPTPEPLADEPARQAQPRREEQPAAEAPKSETPKSETPKSDTPEPAPKRSKGRKGRASVPSWDEIMFGGGKPD